MAEAASAATAAGTDARLRERLARAVVRADSCRGYRGRSNRLAGYIDLTDAVAGELAYCGETHPEVLAVDADSQAAAVGLTRVADELTAAGYAPVVVASGAPHHAHLFARFDTADARRRWAERARQHGGDVRRRIRPPLTPHRDPRYPVRLHRPATAAEACRALEAPGFDALPPSLRRLLATDTPATADGTRSATLYAASRRLAGRGYDADETERLIRRADGCAAAKLAERGHRWWRRYVWTPASHSPTRHTDEPDPVVDLALAEIAAAAQTQPWAGKDGRAAIEVLIALLQLAHAQQRLRPEAAYRTLTLLTGRSLAGVRAALHRLRQHGWLHLARRGGPRWVTTDAGITDDVHGSVWQLTRPDMCWMWSASGAKSMPHPPHGWYTPSAGPPRRQQRRSDLTAGGALGIDGIALVDAVAAATPEGGLSLSECQHACADPNGRTTKRALQRARELGLLISTSTGRGARWIATTDLTRAKPWQDAAEHAGVLGRSETLRAAIERERAEYRQHLDDTFTQRRETAHTARTEWRRQHHPRCGATTHSGNPCQRPVATDGDRCAWHQPNPPRCHAPTRHGPPCQRPVAEREQRCNHHLYSASHQPGLVD